MIRRSLLPLALVALACEPSKPPPAQTFRVHVTVRTPDGEGAGQALATLAPDTGPASCANSGGSVLCETKAPGGALLTIALEGYSAITRRVLPRDPTEELEELTLEWMYTPQHAPPAREALAGICTTFQGLVVPTKKFGLLPWFEIAISSPDLDADDRHAVYAAKHASPVCGLHGDTHLLIAVSWHYSAPGQAYANVRGRDLSLEPEAFRALVEEVRANGFIPTIFWGGDGREHKPGVGETFGYAELMRRLPALVSVLRANPDLDGLLATSPGFDGIIGYDERRARFDDSMWQPDELSNYLTTIRRLMPLSAHCVEPSAGPLNGTLVTFITAAARDALDCVLLETSLEHNDTLWQGAVRVLGPAFVRPPDIDGTDPGCPPTCPWNLARPTSRGPILPIDFEWGLYEHLRGRLTREVAADQRRYRHAMGFRYVN